MGGSSQQIAYTVPVTAEAACPPEYVVQVPGETHPTTSMCVDVNIPFCLQCLFVCLTV